MSAPVTEHERLIDLVDRAAADLEDASALEILQWAAREFGTAWCVASSMADSVVAHLASQAMPGVDVVFLDTGYHFAETIGTRDAVAATLPVTVKTITARQTVAEQDARYGKDLFARRPDQCCALRKVAPLADALAPYFAWASGLRRDESPARADTKVIEWDAKRGLVKLNPIARWTQQDVDDYIADNGILVNPLLFDGYASVGCAPCTLRVAPGEDTRAGRWSGFDKNECGIHL